MLQIVRDTIKEYNLAEPGEHIVLGLSGGPDSVCLFDVLRKLEYQVHPVHVNHQLRPQTAGGDQEFVEKLCAGAGVTCRVFTADCKARAAEEKITTEEAGRKVRYETFRQVAEELEAAGIHAKIAVAHHGDDQAETVLFRILRGTGTDGLAGMEHARAEGPFTVIRPLLDVSREEILEYCRQEGLEYVTDESNDSTSYTRNKIRLELLPLLREQYNEKITESLCRLAQTAGEDRDYLWKEAERAFAECAAADGESVVLDRARAASLEPAIRHRVMLKALQTAGLTEDVTRERLMALDQQMDGGTSTKVIEMPHGYTVTFAFDKIRVRKAEKKAAETVLLLVRIEDDETRVAEMKARLQTSGYPPDEIWLDAEETAVRTGIDVKALAETTCVRGRQEGDQICLAGGTKKLKKLLGEMKIPADERENLRLVAAGKWILAVCVNSPEETRYADALKVSNKTRQILTVKFV